MNLPTDVEAIDMTEQELLSLPDEAYMDAAQQEFFASSCCLNGQSFRGVSPENSR